MRFSLPFFCRYKRMAGKDGGNFGTLFAEEPGGVLQKKTFGQNAHKNRLKFPKSPADNKPET